MNTLNKKLTTMTFALMASAGMLTGCGGDSSGGLPPLNSRPSTEAASVDFSLIPSTTDTILPTLLVSYPRGVLCTNMDLAEDLLLLQDQNSAPGNFIEWRRVFATQSSEIEADRCAVAYIPFGLRTNRKYIISVDRSVEVSGILFDGTTSAQFSTPSEVPELNIVPFGDGATAISFSELNSNGNLTFEDNEFNALEDIFGDVADVFVNSFGNQALANFLPIGNFNLDASVAIEFEEDLFEPSVSAAVQVIRVRDFDQVSNAWGNGDYSLFENNAQLICEGQCVEIRNIGGNKNIIAVNPPSTNWEANSAYLISIAPFLASEQGHYLQKTMYGVFRTGN